MDIVEALAADRGLVSVVGAGGKKTTLYHLARHVDRAVVTATVRIPVFDRAVERVVVTDAPADAIEAAERWPLGVVAAREREDRYAGYDPAVLDGVADRLGDDSFANALLVKADGARTRWLKAPDEREPRIPSRTDVVVPVASVRVVGERLADEHVHRPERVAEVAGLDAGDTLHPADVAAVLADPAGGRKDVPAGATAIPLVNMVDSPELEVTARAVAESVLARTDPTDVPRVVLARMVDDDPLVAVVER